jgi:hypothetical protein
MMLNQIQSKYNFELVILFIEVDYILLYFYRMFFAR